MQAEEADKPKTIRESYQDAKYRLGTKCYYSH